MPPVVKQLHQRDVVTTPDVPLPALARGRAALTLEKCGLAALKLQERIDLFWRQVPLF